MHLGMLILLIVLTSYNSASTFRQITPANLYQMCPYNDFCHSSATKSIKQEDANSCCRPCTCDEDCWKFGTCCPDKDVHQREPAWPCKGTGGTNSYFITDRCPDEEHRSDLLEKCSKRNVTSFEDIIWVSDSVTGLIYQNQFCADCHGIKNILHWHARTKCLKLLGNEKKTLDLDEIFHTPTCKIIMEAPQSLVDKTKPYQCLIPDYNRCNETGLWKHTNQTIELACNEFSMPYVHERVKGFVIYRNVYCFLCNIHQMIPETFSNILSTTCLSNGTLRTFHSFSMLIDFKSYFKAEEAKSGYRCGDSEIFDPYLNVCHRMWCPFGSWSYKGTCEKLVPETEGLGVVITYRVHMLYSNLTVSTSNDYFINKTGMVVFKQIRQVLALDERKCKVCFQELRVLENNTNKLLADYLMYNRVRTDTDCSYENLKAKLAGLIGQKIIVQNKQSESLVFILNLTVTDYAEFRNVTLRPIAYHNSEEYCYGNYFITNEKNCAKMMLSYGMLQNNPVLKQEEALFAKIINASTPNKNESYVDICTDDYFSLMSKVNQAPFLQSYLQALMVMIIIWYVFSNPT